MAVARRPQQRQAVPCVDGGDACSAAGFPDLQATPPVAHEQDQAHNLLSLAGTCLSHMLTPMRATG